MTRQSWNTPLLIISLMLHIRKPTPTPTPNIPGMIPYSHDFLTHLKICVMEMLALMPVKFAFLASEQTKRCVDFPIERMLPNTFSGVISATSHILCPKSS